MNAQLEPEPREDRARAKWPQTLAEMIDVLVDASRRAGMQDDAAWEYAERSVLAIASYIGGRSLYLPRGDRVTEAIRDRRIWAEFRGDNTLDLAQRYNLTERHVQRILAEQRDLHVRRMQQDLFGGS